MTAHCNNSAETAKLHPQHNAYLEAKGYYNQAPLVIAAYSNSVEIAELFLQHNADF